jgi:formylglycine-generating enzyme required for sulfatase activity
VQDGRANARPGTTAAEELATGARIGRYVVIDRVGVGAMGVVYGAYDPELDRKVALKLLKPGQGAREMARARLLREAKAMARLSHPNVVAVHDVGIVDDQVFLAMEFLSGGTVKSWLAAGSRPWREILAVFAAAGRGLAAAHDAGLVHRDFKPDNVLLDKDGRPRVVDFGIAREAGADAEGDEAPVAGGPGASAQAPLDVTARLRESSGSNQPLVTLTKTGALIGTPAYMAPEQFMGQRGDEKSDQFSFCVALYEALYGERPFAGDDVLSISVNVTQEQMRPLPKDRGVPAWIRRVLVRGLKLDPKLRWPSMGALIAALQDDPAAKLRRRLIAGGTIAAVAATAIGARQMVTRGHAEVVREIARHAEEGRIAAATAREKARAAEDLRRRAFEAFDHFDKERGEPLWRETRAVLTSADAAYDQAERAFETAFMIDQRRTEIRERLAETRYDHLLFAEDFRFASKAQALEQSLASIDSSGVWMRALVAPGTVVLRTTPADVHVLLERYDRDPAGGSRSLQALGPWPPARSGRTLAPGSYRITIEGPGLARVLYPFEVDRSERVDIAISPPAASAVPRGFVYIPPGKFWFGDADEQLRTQFLGTVPIHRRQTGGYFIAQRETTYADWIEFLDALPASERALRTPAASATSHGSVQLRRTGAEWELIFQPATHRYVARVGEPIVYAGRDRLARQAWEQFPVAGISPGDVDRYLGWLRDTGRVPGARLCTELEWERAARGADDRLFPHGDDLQPDDANFDATYGRVGSAYGPDAVGSHVRSRSPFDVDDLAGNVLEFTNSSEATDEIVIRGGAYYFNSVSCRSTNREPVPRTLRDVTTGIRVCSSGEVH